MEVLLYKQEPFPFHVSEPECINFGIATEKPMIIEPPSLLARQPRRQAEG